jgi:hypothetical protein
MSTLTRRREKDVQQESWRIFYGDVQVGWIGEARRPSSNGAGGCGFYPLTHRGVRADGIAETFDQARSEFEDAWRDYPPRCTEVDFEEYRRQEAWTAWKYAMWDAGCRMPTQTVDDRARCFCGVEITNRSTSDHIVACHMRVA